MNVFGNTRGATNDVYVRLGIKTRTNAEVRDAFLKEIMPMIENLGLVVPEYNENEQPTK